MPSQQAIESGERLARLLQMQDAYFRDMSPQQRDRLMQAHLASARTPAKRLQAVCELTTLVFGLRAATRNGGDSCRKVT